jgi:DNA-binding NarL/FixJ family response regulator
VSDPPEVQPPTRVVVVDDQALVRGGFTSILDGQPDIDVVGEAGNGQEAVAVCAAVRPDVVCMDVRMPLMDGIEATRRLLAADRPPRVLMLTTFDLDVHVYDALRAGASGFLVKDAPPERLVAAVRSVAAGDELFAPSVLRRLVEAYVREPPHDADGGVLGVLTDRERDVLREMATGRTNAEIAEVLYLSPATVKTHVTRILTKLGLRDRVQAVVLAYETGVVRRGGAPSGSA